MGPLARPPLALAACFRFLGSGSASSSSSSRSPTSASSSLPAPASPWLRSADGSFAFPRRPRRSATPRTSHKRTVPSSALDAATVAPALTAKASRGSA
eukprot:scaffold14900_cov103-Isochrysis_galbana.AAC.1